MNEVSHNVLQNEVLYDCNMFSWRVKCRKEKKVSVKKRGKKMRVASKKYEKRILICNHNHFGNETKEEIHKRLKSPLNCFQVVEIRVEKRILCKKRNFVFTCYIRVEENLASPWSDKIFDWKILFLLFWCFILL